jgi:hypothetical protein
VETGAYSAWKRSEKGMDIYLKGNLND